MSSESRRFSTFVTWTAERVASGRRAPPSYAIGQDPEPGGASGRVAARGGRARHVEGAPRLAPVGARRPLGALVGGRRGRGVVGGGAQAVAVRLVLHAHGRRQLQHAAQRVAHARLGARVRRRAVPHGQVVLLRTRHIVYVRACRDTTRETIHISYAPLYFGL
ncbi:jg6110 [Pararge aegeria aegeria]|uniref:Jg6110 protein n=1 Tax=Pararge aegeria aegeria TaxID=348720 RepID=A0A8S4RB92_9NEOP|nr:jg6110 [Pararge aegeria aegeria]